MTKWPPTLLAGVALGRPGRRGCRIGNVMVESGAGNAAAGVCHLPERRGRDGRVLNTSGVLVTKGHPFFEPIGTNGRACVTCHQPSDGMSLSVRSIRERWTATGGKDPLFAAVDGMNCPSLPPGDPRSHSQLLDRGLFRIALVWPPQRPDGTPIDPEFSIEVVRDPGGCNTDPTYGLSSTNPTISVYRRPRPVANTKYTTHQNFGVGPFIGKNGMPSSVDPETGKPTSMNLMSDARAATLAVQAQDAARTHLQVAAPLSAAQSARITEFERQVYVARSPAAMPAAWWSRMGRRPWGLVISPRPTPASSATTRRATCFRWAGSGRSCRERVTRP